MMLDTHSNTTSAIVSRVGRWVTVCQAKRKLCKIKTIYKYKLTNALHKEIDLNSCTVPKSRAAVDYTLTGIEPHRPSRSV